MAKIEARRLTRKLLILLALVLGLIAQTASYNATSVAKSGAADAVLPCCSACDVENPPIICRRGCSPSCVKHN